MSQVGESSVEEILESIKKVIARDNRASSTEQRRLRETRGLGPSDSGVPANAVEPEDILDLADAENFLDPPLFLDSSDEADAVDNAGNAEEPLVTPGARASMRESLAALAVLAQPGASPQIVRSGETSLEGLTRDLLRPALTEWLDKNLPALVERMVAAEIARIVGRKG